jgi:hypothetical protein
MQFILEDQHARVLHRGWVELELALKALLIPVVSWAVLAAGPVSGNRFSSNFSFIYFFKWHYQIAIERIVLWYRSFLNNLLEAPTRTFQLHREILPLKNYSRQSA